MGTSTATIQRKKFSQVQSITNPKKAIRKFNKLLFSIILNFLDTQEDFGTTKKKFL